MSTILIVALTIVLIVSAMLVGLLLLVPSRTAMAAGVVCMLLAVWALTRLIFKSGMTPTALILISVMALGFVFVGASAYADCKGFKLLSPSSWPK